MGSSQEVHKGLQVFGVNESLVMPWNLIWLSSWKSKGFSEGSLQDCMMF